MVVFDVEGTSNGGSGGHVGDGSFTGDKAGDRDDLGAKGEGGFGAFSIEFGIQDFDVGAELAIFESGFLAFESGEGVVIDVVVI